MTKLTMNQVQHLVNSPDVNFETVGYINGKNMSVIQTGVSETNTHNGRKYVHFPINKKIQWHTHPSTDGFWPSFEDLNKCYSDQGVLHILFTRFGTWLFRGFGKVPDTFHHDLLYQNWDWLNLVLTTRTSLHGWNESEIMVYINHFVSFTNRIGYHIEFLSNFKSMDMNKYTQLVQNRITHLS
jgi:hypothetical protein